MTVLALTSDGSTACNISPCAFDGTRVSYEDPMLPINGGFSSG
jgi:hypothetical protein